MRRLLSRCLLWGAFPALLPHLALAHTGQPPQPHDIWRAWSFDPLVILGVTLLTWLYARGVTRLWRRAGRGRGISGWRVAAFAGGILALLIALVSPLDALGSALFSAHMVQHLVLILIAAPLLVLGAPLVPLLWALPLRVRRGIVCAWKEASGIRVIWRALTQPVVAWLLAITVLWTWHIPALYEAALRSSLVHAVEHGCFLTTALLFWWVLLQPAAHARLDRGVGVLYLFAAGLANGVLGALLTFAASVWYPIYADRVGPWGLTPLQDQQLAGVIMWVPASVIYLIAAGTLFVTWLTSMNAPAGTGTAWTEEAAQHVAHKHPV
jgi:cytochrome c oxidase assembly factor CtaG